LASTPLAEEEATSKFHRHRFINESNESVATTATMMPF
jgi:hypothetical protein